MAFERISEEELAAVGVESLDDQPGLAPAAMKAKFEETSKELLAPKYNELAEQLEAETAAGSMGAQVPEGLPEATEKTVQAVLLALMIYVQAHEGKQDNPHKVTAAQAGAYTKQETDQAIEDKVVEIGAGDMQMSTYDPEHLKKPIYQAIAQAVEEAVEELLDLVMKVENYDPQGKNQDVFAYGPHLYKAVFALDGWSGDGPYTQTASVTAVDGGPSVTTDTVMTSGLFCDDTVQGEAQDALLNAAFLVDKGTKTFGSGTITCVLYAEKPEADAEVYFNARKGGT